MIRLTVPAIGEDDLQAVREVLLSGRLVQGERVAAFERSVCDFLGGHSTVAVSSGTAALQVALAALEVGPGDAVMVPSYSFPATVNVVELLGARPVFVEIEPDTFNIDVEHLELAVKEVLGSGATRPGAILPVHAFGQMADMDAVCAVADRYGLPVVEDAACALGARRKGKAAGTWGSAGCFSFHPRKAVTTGEGGVVVTADAELERRARALRNHGLDPEAPAPDFVFAGWNYRMTEIQAALGVTQMAKAHHLLEARRLAAARYDELLASLPVGAPVVASDSFHVYQSYVVLVSDSSSAYRDGVIARMRQRGVEAAIGTWHLPLATYYREKYGHRPGDFPVTDDVFARSLALPLYPAIDASTQERVVEVLRASLD